MISPAAVGPRHSAPIMRSSRRLSALSGAAEVARIARTGLVVSVARSTIATAGLVGDAAASHRAGVQDQVPRDRVELDPRRIAERLHESGTMLWLARFQVDARLRRLRLEPPSRSGIETEPD